MKRIILLAGLLSAMALLSCGSDGRRQDGSDDGKDNSKPSRTCSVDRAAVYVELEDQTADDDVLVQQIKSELEETIETDFLPEGSAYRFFEETPDQIVNGVMHAVTERIAKVWGVQELHPLL